MTAPGFGPWGSPPDPPPGGPSWGPAWGSGPDRWRVWRDPENGWIAGVCAGIAENAGVNPAIVRVIAVITLIFFIVPALVAYVALAIILPVRPPELFANPQQEGFWRGMRSRPQTTLEQTAAQFDDLERRLARMEKAVTSRDFDLHRGFRDLGR
jgi:phage shock protein C